MDKVKIGQFIADCRKDKKITQEQLAEKLNISKNAVSKWERGATTPTADKIVLLAKFFEVSSDYILGLEKHL